MGMVASTTIWVGLKLKPREYVPLPEDVQGRLDEYIEVKVGKMSFRYFYHYDETIGFGVELWRGSGHDDAQLFHLIALGGQAEILERKVKVVFSEWGITTDPNVFIVTDYS